MTVLAYFAATSCDLSSLLFAFSLHQQVCRSGLDCVFGLSALSRQKRWATFLDVAEGLVLHNPSKKAHVTSRAKRILFTNRTRARLYAGDRASWRGLDALFLVDGFYDEASRRRSVRS